MPNRTMGIKILLGLVFLILPLGCGGGNIGPGSGPTEPEDSLALNNPLMGWAPAGNSDNLPLPHRLVFYYFDWRDLELSKGNFQWDALETKFKLNQWFNKKDKVRAVLRFRMDSPSEVKPDSTETSIMRIPIWLYDELKVNYPNDYGTWYEYSSDGKTYRGFSPNYQSPTLIAEHERVLQALGARYNKDPRIAFVEIGSIGHWGEFHTSRIPRPKNGEPVKPGYFAPKNISEDIYAEAYHKYFPNKIILMRYPCAVLNKYNKTDCWGLYNDMMGDVQNTREWFLDWIANGHYDYYGEGGASQHHPPLLADWWKYGASGGEFGDIRVFTGASSSFEETLREIKDCHTTWLGPACPPAFSVYGFNGSFTDPTFLARVNTALRTMGYRFKVQQVNHAVNVRAGESLNITMTVTNKGVAPFYYPWPLELSLADSKDQIVYQTETQEDIRTWLPGDNKVTLNMSIPANLSKGKYTLCIAILDPDDSPKKPAVDFAMPGKRSDGRFSLDTVTVD